MGNGQVDCVSSVIQADAPDSGIVLSTNWRIAVFYSKLLAVMMMKMMMSTTMTMMGRPAASGH